MFSKEKEREKVKVYERKREKDRLRGSMGREEKVKV